MKEGLGNIQAIKNKEEHIVISLHEKWGKRVKKAWLQRGKHKATASVCIHCECWIHSMCSILGLLKAVSGAYRKVSGDIYIHPQRFPFNYFMPTFFEKGRTQIQALLCISCEQQHLAKSCTLSEFQCLHLKYRTENIQEVAKKVASKFTRKLFSWPFQYLCLITNRTRWWITRHMLREIKITLQTNKYLHSYF